MSASSTPEQTSMSFLHAFKNKDLAKAETFVCESMKSRVKSQFGVTSDGYGSTPVDYSAYQYKVLATTKDGDSATVTIAMSAPDHHETWSFI